MPTSHESATSVTAPRRIVRVSGAAIAVSLLAIATATTACARGEWPTGGSEQEDKSDKDPVSLADGGMDDDRATDSDEDDSDDGPSAGTEGCDSGDVGCPCAISDDCAPNLECNLGACLPTVDSCGDGVQDEGEECDGGPENADDAACKSDCTQQVCGDGFVGPDEVCDDGNADDADGCTQQCDCRLTFDDDYTVGWEFTGGWAIYDEAPLSDLPAVPFVSQGPVFGTDGNRVAPYPGLEDEISSATTISFTIPPVLRFHSWHVDEGGSDHDSYDNKRILISADEGETWSPVVDCAAGPNEHLPLCQLREDPRDESDWDEIEIEVADFTGLSGRLRFEYEAGDTCCEFEQGWFIDDLNIFGCT